jgi:hypothetical protein
MSPKSLSIRILRFCAWSLFVTFALYGLLIVLPGLILGAHLRPAADIYYFIYNPQDYPQWVASIGFVLQAATALALVVIPMWMVISGSTLALILRRKWAQLEDGQRRLASAALTTPLITLLYILSPIGYPTLVWFFD